jgi:arsenate reductase
MMSVTIYHNPRCEKSRPTLALLQKKGVTPIVVRDGRAALGQPAEAVLKIL